MKSTYLTIALLLSPLCAFADSFMGEYHLQSGSSNCPVTISVSKASTSSIRIDEKEKDTVDEEVGVMPGLWSSAVINLGTSYDGSWTRGAQLTKNALSFYEAQSSSGAEIYRATTILEKNNTGALSYSKEIASWEDGASVIAMSCVYKN